MNAIYYATYNDDDYLMHHGIKGQKWGIRRYQNEDGSLTALGKRKYLTLSDRSAMAEGLRYSANRKMAIAAKAKQDQMAKSIASKADAASIEKYRSIANNSKTLTNETKNLMDAHASYKKTKVKNDPITMSDAELRQAINRMNMERQYRDLVASNSTSVGRQRAQAILNGTSAALGITASALGIALTIKQLRGK